MDLTKENIVSTKNLLWTVGISLLVGAVLLFLAMWIFGIFGTAEDREILENYKSKKAKNEKVIQTALAEAEKQKKEAEVLRKQNEELAAKFTERDKKRDSEIIQNDNRRKEENEKIVQEYNSDIERVSNMPDDERAADNCSRLARLSKDNPSLAQFQCTSNLPDGP